MNHNLGSLSDSERLWLWRVRSGHTQVWAAKALGRGLRTYQGQERGKVALWGDEPLPRATTRLTDAEMCALARRRSGWGLRGTAKRAKVSHVKLLADEASGAASLVAFWKQQRYEFAQQGA